jgi:hypothetical protein
MDFNYNKHLLLAYIFFIFWICYGAFSLNYAGIRSEGIQDLFFRVENLFTFYIITQFFTNKNRLQFYEYAIMFSVIFLICVNVWEITTLQHLSSSRKFGTFSYVPTAACYNENNLASFYLVCCSLWFFRDKPLLKYLGAILLLLVFIVFLIQGARLAMLVSLPFILYHFIFKTGKIYKILTILILFYSSYYLYNNVPVLRYFVDYHMRTYVLTFGSESESQLASSAETRLVLYQIALEKLIRTKGLGVGMGNFERTTDPQSIYISGNTANAHSYFFEILGNEGIIGITLLVLILTIPLVVIYRDKKQKSLGEILNFFKYSNNEKTCLVFLLFFVVAVSLPSSINTHLFYWNILGYTYALMLNRSEHEHIR